MYIAYNILHLYMHGKKFPMKSREFFSTIADEE